MTSQQSTHHLFMIEPAGFFANPETMDTNVYQAEQANLSKDETLQKALTEFRTYRDNLVAHGVMVTTALGYKDCPDMIFPNWFSTHENDLAFLYPMMSPNRQAEKKPEVIEMLKGMYSNFEDWSIYEKDGLFLESTASLVMDRINKRAYAGLSKRTNPELAQRWCDFMGYELIAFETQSHTGKPVYHTDYLMFIGTGVAGLCGECIAEDSRDQVVGKLKETHEVIDISTEQLKASCGNSLEVIGKDGEKMLTISSGAYVALKDEQIETLNRYYKSIIHSPLETLETYGGGSARCTLAEFF